MSITLICKYPQLYMEAGEIGKFTDRREDISAASTYLWSFERKLGSIQVRQLVDMRRRKKKKKEKEKEQTHHVRQVVRVIKQLPNKGTKLHTS